METTRYALFFLVGVCLWKTSCTSSIQLCTNGPSTVMNGTDIPAMLGKPVSVVFCVQCDPSLYISQYIKIHHPHHPTHSNYYYRNNNDVHNPIIVNITTSANKATINITIKAVKKEDFNDQFSVKLHTNKSLSDNSVFIFRLSDAATSGTTTSETSLIPSTQPKTPAIISIRTSPSATSTELSTVSSRASTASTSTSTVGPTQDTKQCWPQNTSLCPANWYQVDKDTCLLVIREPRNDVQERECKEYSSRSVNRNTIINLRIRSCLTKILGELKVAANKYVVRVSSTEYVSVYNGTRVKARGDYIVVCTNRTYSTDHSSVGQTPQGDGSESSAVLIAVPPVCFIVIVFIIVSVVWYRVKASRATAARPEEIIDRSSGNEDSGEVTYANMREPAVCRVPEGQKAERQQEAEHQQEAEQETDSLQFQDDWNTADLNDKESGRFISQDGLVYITVVNANKQINKRSKRGKNPPKQKNDDEARVEYITLDFEKTGKLQLAEEEENKDDDSGDKNDTRQ